MELWSAFIIGLFGSLHCIGMCGPIVLALPYNNFSGKSQYLLGRLFYNSGRIASYMSIGFVLGLLGNGITMFVLQRSLSIILGVIILTWVMLSFFLKNKLTGLNVFNSYSAIIKTYFGKFMGKGTKASLLILGILNGCLPCGLVYIAFAGAISTANPVKSALFMAAFGLGTLPLMFLASISTHLISLDLRRKFNKLIPVFTLMLSLILILRGMNLGIPYISPKMENSKSHVLKTDCCSE
ncbi:MAG: sulfite exporter TauE/SafE family protein [Bacteroidota bacterium]|nr:sulfite exporter TauE/SafE family protein [Bacteroidota bacterium]MDP4194912.1 sulfite exporter TauE/SafE family protein [Bacteroidota bacterium]